ncbi:hypothetical protein ABBQ38_006377 [Trebouxia sp. C0009 RCD-2024]
MRLFRLVKVVRGQCRRWVINLNPFTWIDSEFIQAAFALARPTAILRSRRSLSALGPGCHNQFTATSDQHSQDNQITSSPKTGVSDAAGEAAKARHLLILWRPDILTLDCFSHQFNLPVGDYLNKKKTDHRYIDVVSDAIDLAAWWIRHSVPYGML